MFFEGLKILYSFNNIRRSAKKNSRVKSKCGGVDRIHAKTILSLEEFIFEPLVHIFNTCIGIAVWPDASKSAEIKPIFKDVITN